MRQKRGRTSNVPPKKLAISAVRHVSSSIVSNTNSNVTSIKADSSRREFHSFREEERDSLLLAYRTMRLARYLDERTVLLYKQNLCHFQIGCAGHEACQAAVAQVFKSGVDWFYPYYRDLVVCLGLGLTTREALLNALNCEDDPCSHGRQMPMHYGKREAKIVSQSSPTGTQFLQAVGCALGAKRIGASEVVYVSAGEGTCSQGDFHEALNWAARERLPVIFLIQNNDFAISVHVSEQLTGASVYKLCLGYEGLHAYEVDGTNFLESKAVLERAYLRAKSGEGPTLIEAHVPRLQSHSISDNELKYRSKEQLETEQLRDPIPALAELIIDSGVATSEEIKSLDIEIRREVEEASLWAETQKLCDPTNATSHTLNLDDPVFSHVETVPEGKNSHFVDAVNHALDEELARDSRVYVFGQDVAFGKGGVFGATVGLTTKYGEDRIFNAPLAESSIIGVAIGLATRGLRPVPEIQFADYIWTAMMQIRNELAMMRYRSGSEWTCPMVVRVPVGGYIHGGCYHSQNIEATFAHFPGLLVVYPSNASDAHGLLKSAIRCDNPVLFLEHKGLYRQVYAKGNEGGSEFLLPIGKAKTVLKGDDLTIITWGSQVQKSILAAGVLAKEGYSVEVIDLRTIVPFDQEAVFSSVRRTNRVLIAHEDVTFMGFGSELAAQIGQICFGCLDAPVMRVGMKYAAAVPHSPILEQAVLPQTSDIVDNARLVLKW